MSPVGAAMKVAGMTAFSWTAAASLLGGARPVAVDYSAVTLLLAAQRAP
jgi:hypothetical protein